MNNAITDQLTFCSPIIANMPRSWIQLDTSSAFRTRHNNFDMYSHYSYNDLPIYTNQSGNDTTLPDWLWTRIQSSQTTPAQGVTNVTTNTPPILQSLFQGSDFWVNNGVCHYWLHGEFGPLGKYTQNSQFYLNAFYHDQQACMSWFTLHDELVNDGSVGSKTHPCVVSGVSTESLEADEDFDPTILNLNRFVFVAPSVEEFLWRNYVEDEIVKELFENQTPIDDLQGELKEYVEHYRSL